MQWAPLILATMPAWPAFASLIKAVVFFVKDFCEAFVIEFKVAYYMEVMHERNLNHSD